MKEKDKKKMNEKNCCTLLNVFRFENMLYLFSLLSIYSLRWELWVASDTSSSTSTSPLVSSVTEKYRATSANKLAEDENYVCILNLNHPKFRLTVMRQWVANIIFIISHPVPKSTQQTLLIFLRLSKQSDFYAKVTKKWKYLQFSNLYEYIENYNFSKKAKCNSPYNDFSMSKKINNHVTRLHEFQAVW